MGALGELAASNTAIKPERDLPARYFADFISFIDRGNATTKTYICNLRQFAAWLNFSGIKRPERQDIIDYRRFLTEEHEAIVLDKSSAAGWAYRLDPAGHRITIKNKPNTAKLYLQSVRQFFAWTAATGLYPNVAAGIHTPKTRADIHRKDALTPVDVVAIEDSIKARAQGQIEAATRSRKDQTGRTERATEQGKRLFAMYLLAVNCGLRTIELNRANVGDIETRNGASCLYVWGKGHTEPDAKKTLAPEVKAAIDDYLAARTDAKTANSPLFVSTGNRSGGKRMATTTISTMLKRAMQAAGYDSDRITAHSLRHTAGTNVQELTGDLYLTQLYMRHSNPATTEIYLHNKTEQQESKVARELYKFYHSARPQETGEER